MEISLIGASPAVGCRTRDVCRLGSDVNRHKISSSRFDFGQTIRCPNLSLRVTAQSVYPSQPAVASDHNAISSPNDGVKLYVGLPKDSVSDCNGVRHARAISAGLKALKLLGVEGVELPIWWGVAEKEAMGKYEWSGYLAVVEMIQNAGLKLHVSLCFHASKQPNIPLPKWVSDVGESQPDIFFTDRSGQRYQECLSFSVDDLPVFNGKTSTQVYKEFIESFKIFFSPFMGSTITGVSVGMGPDGELRYPSYHDQGKSSVSHGAGEFQCYDENMMGHLKQHAEHLGNPLWGLSGPHNSPSYDQQPILNTFFKEGGSWETPYGDFFLSWYSSQLVSHADRMLSLAASTFHDTPVRIYGKLPLIHSWYRSRSHPAEVTAGFYNTVGRDGYEEIVKVFSRNSCRMILPGMDLLDEQQPNESFSSPEVLLAKIRDACRSYDVEVCGQNLWAPGAPRSFEQIKKNLVGENALVDLFIYERMGAEFFSPQKFPSFVAFVRSLDQPEVGSDDLAMNGSESAAFLAGTNRKLQAA